jgi:hypothetical protein
MAMEVVQLIAGAHDDALAGIAFNAVNRQIYTCAEGDKAIKVCWCRQLASCTHLRGPPQPARRTQTTTHRCGTSRRGSCNASRRCTAAW